MVRIQKKLEFNPKNTINSSLKQVLTAFYIRTFIHETEVFEIEKCCRRMACTTPRRMRYGSKIKKKMQ